MGFRRIALRIIGMLCIVIATINVLTEKGPDEKTHIHKKKTHAKNELAR